MDRLQKIEALRKVQEGIPSRFALHPEKYRALYGKPNSDTYLTSEREVVTKADQEKYLPEAMIFINVSKQFPDIL
jgi:hypothetical protein